MSVYKIGACVVGLVLAAVVLIAVVGIATVFAARHEQSVTDGAG